MSRRGERLKRKGYIFKKCVGCGRKVPKKICSKCKSRRFSWAYRVDVAQPGEPRQQKTRSGFETEGEAQAELRPLLREQRGGVWVTDEQTTVGNYLENWVEAVDIRPSTRAGYEGHVRNHLVPRLGSYRLQNLDKFTIKSFYTTLADQGGNRRTGGPLTARTIHRIHNTLHRALEDAVEDGLIIKNPADGAHSEPRAVDHDMITWTADELAKFLRSVREDRWYPLWRTLAMTGMRRAEVAGLKWEQVDLTARTIIVQRTRTRVRGGVVEGPPKTNRGRRTIDLDEGTVDALFAWAAQQMTEQSEWGDAYQDEGWVFTWEDGSPLEPTGISSRFRRRLRNAGVPRMRLHDLRDTHATLLLKAGVPPHVVSQRLGHSTVAFTLQVYAHVLPGQQQEAAEKVAALVDG